MNAPLIEEDRQYEWSKRHSSQNATETLLNVRNFKNASLPDACFQAFDRTRARISIRESHSRPHVALLIEAPPIETCPERILRKHCESGCHPLSIRLDHYRPLRQCSDIKARFDRSLILEICKRGATGRESSTLVDAKSGRSDRRPTDRPMIPRDTIASAVFEE